MDEFRNIPGSSGGDLPTDGVNGQVLTWENGPIWANGGGGGGGASWGSITGTLSNQTDLQSALNLKAPLASPAFTGTASIGATTANGFSIPSAARGLRVDGDGTTSTSAWGYLQLRGNGNAHFDNYGKIFFTAQASVEPVEPRRAGIEVTGLSTSGNTGIRFFTNTAYNGTYRDTALLQTNQFGQTFFSASGDNMPLNLGTVSSGGSTVNTGVTLYPADVGLWHSTAFTTDNTYDFGVFSDTSLGRPRSGYFGTSGLKIGTYSTGTTPNHLLDVRSDADSSVAQFTNTATGFDPDAGGLIVGIDSAGAGQILQQTSSLSLGIYTSNTNFTDNGGSIQIQAASAGGDTGTIGGNITILAGNGPDIPGYIHLSAQKDISISTGTGTSSGVLLSSLALTPQTLNIVGGGTDTVPNGSTAIFLNAGGTLVSYTLVLPSAPRDGMVLLVSSNQNITSLTVTPNSGQTLVPTITTITKSSPVRLIYDLSNTQWLAA